jgi:hypothetical protein
MKPSQKHKENIWAAYLASTTLKVKVITNNNDDDGDDDDDDDDNNALTPVAPIIAVT